MIGNFAIALARTVRNNMGSNGIDGLPAILHRANNLKPLAECPANYRDHFLVIISEHDTNLVHGNPFGMSSTKRRTLTMKLCS
jgi:hypothetical protein